LFPGQHWHRVPAYAIDDETAIKVVDGTVEVVSEGHWKLLPS
jgi:dipeptidase E